MVHLRTFCGPIPTLGLRMPMAIDSVEMLNERLMALQQVKPLLVVSRLVVIGPYLDEFMSRFVCKRCGKCEELGAVYVDEDDIKLLAKALNTSTLSFSMKYTARNYDGRTVLKQPCPFYKDKGCTIHDKSQPKVCRLFPAQSVPCKDGIYRLGVRKECEAGVEFLTQFEAEKLAIVPEVA